MTLFSSRARLAGALAITLAGLVPGLVAPAHAVDAMPLPSASSPALQAALQDYAAHRHSAARRAFERLARAGDPVAQYNLAVMHLRGELPQPSQVRAVALLEQSAGAGFVTAQFALGKLYDGKELGRPDPARALGWYRRAAEAGSADAQVEVATAYYLGRGVTADAATAASWYRQAATAGDEGAQYLLASMYEHGLGLPADARLAHYWYEAAGRNGDMAGALKARAMSREMASPTADKQATADVPRVTSAPPPPAAASTP
jgi:TPR repeat protein